MHLHTLSNRDKHHMLAISALNAEYTWRFVARDGRVLRSDKTTEFVHEGGVLAEVAAEFVINGEKAQLQSQLSTRVRFTELAFSGFDVAGACKAYASSSGNTCCPPLPPSSIPFPMRFA
jgi:hypothetical protein